MCETIDHRRVGTGTSIKVYFERDASLRATEVIVVNEDREGEERQAVKMIAADNGKFIKVGGAVDLIDGVDIVI